MRGGARRLYSIFFRSVWQIPQASTRTRISPGAHYHSSRLMSIDAWRGQKVVFDFLQIGVADPTSFHAHQDFARSDFRNGHLLDGDDTLAFVHSRVHGWRDTPVRIGNRQ